MLEMLHTFWARNAAVASTDGNAAQPFFDAFAATVAAAKGTEDATYLASFLRTAMTSSSTADADAQDSFAAPAVAYAAAQAALCDGECAAKEASWLAALAKHVLPTHALQQQRGFQAQCQFALDICCNSESCKCQRAVLMALLQLPPAPPVVHPSTQAGNCLMSTPDGIRAAAVFSGSREHTLAVGACIVDIALSSVQMTNHDMRIDISFQAVKAVAGGQRLGWQRVVLGAVRDDAGSIQVLKATLQHWCMSGTLPPSHDKLWRLRRWQSPRGRIDTQPYTIVVKANELAALACEDAEYMSDEEYDVLAFACMEFTLQ